jgi:hypothetical protein
LTLPLASAVARDHDPDTVGGRRVAGTECRGSRTR